jgi:hypothetical protein
VLWRHIERLVPDIKNPSLETGLLFNFGAESLQFKRKSRTYSPKAKIMNPMDETLAAGGRNYP